MKQRKSQVVVVLIVLLTVLATGSAWAQNQPFDVSSDFSSEKDFSEIEALVAMDIEDFENYLATLDIPDGIEVDATKFQHSLSEFLVEWNSPAKQQELKEERENKFIIEDYAVKEINPVIKGVKSNVTVYNLTGLVKSELLKNKASIEREIVSLHEKAQIELATVTEAENHEKLPVVVEIQAFDNEFTYIYSEGEGVEAELLITKSNFEDIMEASAEHIAHVCETKATVAVPHSVDPLTPFMLSPTPIPALPGCNNGCVNDLTPADEASFKGHGVRLHMKHPSSATSNKMKFSVTLPSIASTIVPDDGFYNQFEKFDANYDNKFDEADISHILYHYLYTTSAATYWGYVKQFDLNNNNMIDLADIVALWALVGPYQAVGTNFIYGGFLNQAISTNGTASSDLGFIYQRISYSDIFQPCVWSWKPFYKVFWKNEETPTAGKSIIAGPLDFYNESGGPGEVQYRNGYIPGHTINVEIRIEPKTVQGVSRHNLILQTAGNAYHSDRNGNNSTTYLVNICYYKNEQSGVNKYFAPFTISKWRIAATAATDNDANPIVIQKVYLKPTISNIQVSNSSGTYSNPTYTEVNRFYAIANMPSPGASWSPTICKGF
ncbi:MAG: hypothetical protein LBB91_01520 [Clostridiales bacterium]|jgi:hypothetical protein|nr:hypothetical protein [Clostridiales bacterium]